MMIAPRLASRLHQRGIVTVMAAIFLITAVIFALSQTLGITGSSSLDNKQQMDSVAAFFLAESGLERGQSILTSANPITNAVCTGIGGGPFALGMGTFTLSGTSTPASCDSSGNTPCTSCVIQSVGIVGAASRTLTRTMSLTAVNGTACNASIQTCNSPTMVLKNTYPNTAIALFNLAHRRQGAQTAASCTLPQCALQWNIYAQNGANSVGDMGNSVTIPSGQTYTITQTLSSSRNYAEVGALFPGNSAPSIVGAYWDDTNPSGGGSKTVGKSADSSGQTNNGTATSSGTCTSPVTDSKQACTSWCYGGDRLVFGVGAHSDNLNDQLSSVTFNTAGTLAQNIALTRIAKFPNSSIPGAPTDVYSEVWSAHNYNLSPTPVASNASSYKGNGTGAIGATWTGASNSASGTTLTVGTFAGYPASIISIGDTISSSGGSGNITGSPTIVSQLTSSETGGMATGTGGRGTYRLNSSQTVANVAGRNWTANSTILNVSACIICYFQPGTPGDTISGTGFPSGTISSQLTPLLLGNAGRLPEATGGVGRYVLSGPATNVASANTLRAGTPGPTIYLPSSQSMPAVTTPNTRIAIASGTGKFRANTTVTAVTSPVPNAYNTNSLTVSPDPSIAVTGFTPQALDVATICGGTCAFFDHVAATTTFTIAKSAGTDYWASGFMCLSGADIPPIPVTSSTVNASTWSEVVQ